MVDGITVHIKTALIANWLFQKIYKQVFHKMLYFSHSPKHCTSYILKKGNKSQRQWPTSA